MLKIKVKIILNIIKQTLLFIHCKPFKYVYYLLNFKHQRLIIFLLIRNFILKIGKYIKGSKGQTNLIYHKDNHFQNTFEKVLFNFINKKIFADKIWGFIGVEIQQKLF